MSNLKHPIALIPMPGEVPRFEHQPGQAAALEILMAEYTGLFIDQTAPKHVVAHQTNELEERIFDDVDNHWRWGLPEICMTDLWQALCNTAGTATGDLGHDELADWIIDTLMAYQRVLEMMRLLASLRVLTPIGIHHHVPGGFAHIELLRTSVPDQFGRLVEELCDRLNVDHPTMSANTSPHTFAYLVERPQRRTGALLTMQHHDGEPSRVWCDPIDPETANWLPGDLAPTEIDQILAALTAMLEWDGPRPPWRTPTPDAQLLAATDMRGAAHRLKHFYEGCRRVEAPDSGIVPVGRP